MEAFRLDQSRSTQLAGCETMEYRAGKVCSKVPHLGIIWRVYLKCRSQSPPAQTS